MNTIENVQRTFTRRAYLRCGLPKASYSERLKNLNLKSLKECRVIADLTLVYKILHGLISIPEKQLFRRVKDVTRGHPLRIQSICPIYDDPKYWFSNRVCPVWNSLPESVVSAPNVYTFKRRLNQIQIRKSFTSKIR